MKCSTCGAPPAALVDGECRFCGTLVATPVAPVVGPVAQETWAPPPVEPWALPYRGFSRRLWRAARLVRGGDFTGSYVAEALLVVVAGLALAGWGLAFLALLAVDPRRNSPTVRRVLAASVEVPAVGLALGAGVVGLLGWLVLLAVGG